MKKVKQLTKDVFSDTKCVSIGNLDKEMIDFIVDKKKEFADCLSSNTDIAFWKDRIKHTENHIKDFYSEDEYEYCFKNIPTIIKNPDYISIHPTDNSLSFIKDFKGHTSVAVRISSDGKMAYRTMYPLRDSQLNSYLSSGRAWKYKTK